MHCLRSFVCLSWPVWAVLCAGCAARVGPAAGDGLFGELSGESSACALRCGGQSACLRAVEQVERWLSDAEQAPPAWVARVTLTRGSDGRWTSSAPGLVPDGAGYLHAGYWAEQLASGKGAYRRVEGRALLPRHPMTLAFGVVGDGGELFQEITAWGRRYRSAAPLPERAWLALLSPSGQLVRTALPANPHRLPADFAAAAAAKATGFAAGQTMAELSRAAMPAKPAARPGNGRVWVMVLGGIAGLAAIVLAPKVAALAGVIALAASFGQQTLAGVEGASRIASVCGPHEAVEPGPAMALLTVLDACANAGGSGYPPAPVCSAARTATAWWELALLSGGDWPNDAEAWVAEVAGEVAGHGYPRVLEAMHVLFAKKPKKGGKRKQSSARKKRRQATRQEQEQETTASDLVSATAFHSAKKAEQAARKANDELARCRDLFGTSSSAFLPWHSDSFREEKKSMCEDQDLECISYQKLFSGGFRLVLAVCRELVYSGQGGAQRSGELVWHRR